VTHTKLTRLSYWGVRKPPDCSTAWGNLLKLRNSFKKFYRYEVGREKEFSFWFDPWLHGKALNDEFPSIEFADTDLTRTTKVKEVWRLTTWRLPEPITEDIAAAWDMVNTVQGNIEGGDRIVWTESASGMYSIASGFNAIRQKKLAVPWLKLVWGIGNIPK
jgi:hypothetical protein